MQSCGILNGMCLSSIVYADCYGDISDKMLLKEMKQPLVFVLSIGIRYSSTTRYIYPQCHTISFNLTKRTQRVMRWTFIFNSVGLLASLSCWCVCLMTPFPWWLRNWLLPLCRWRTVETFLPFSHNFQIASSRISNDNMTTPAPQRKLIDYTQCGKPVPQPRQRGTRSRSVTPIRRMNDFNNSSSSIESFDFTVDSKDDVESGSVEFYLKIPKRESRRPTSDLRERFNDRKPRNGKKSSLIGTVISEPNVTRRSRKVQQ